MTRHPKSLSPQRKADLDAWSSIASRQPVPLAEADYPTVDDLIAAVRGAEHPGLSDGMRFVARLYEEAGFQVHVIDGAVYADLVDVDPATGVADCRLSVRTTRED